MLNLNLTDSKLLTDTVAGRELISQLEASAEAKRVADQREQFQALQGARASRDRDVPAARARAEAAASLATEAEERWKAAQLAADQTWAEASQTSANADNRIATIEQALRAAASPLLSEFISETHQLEIKASTRGDSREGPRNQRTGERAPSSNTVGITQYLNAVRLARREAEASKLEPLTAAEVRARLAGWRQAIGDLEEAALMMPVEG